MVDFFFGFFAVLAVASGLMSMSRKEPVHSALYLVLTLFSLAVLYLLLSGEFLFAIQIFVYAGGIMVLYLFVIFLVATRGGESWTSERTLHHILGPAVVVIFSPVLILWLMGMPVHQVDVPIPTVEQLQTMKPDPGEIGPVEASAYRMNTEGFGVTLFRRYLFPFEVISIVLLVGMLGAIVLGRKRFTSYSETEEAKMLAEAHYHSRRLAPSGSAEEILSQLQHSDTDKGPGEDFEVFPEYEEES